MDKTHNVFISHYGKDDEHVQRLKQRLKDGGYNIRNGSIDSTKYQDKRPSNLTIARYLRRGIKWASTFICLIGEKTHTRGWVNYEIKNAQRQGKRIVGIYKYGCKDSVELPGAFKEVEANVLGWNSIDKLGAIISGDNFPYENVNGSTASPIYPISRIC